MTPGTRRCPGSQLYGELPSHRARRRADGPAEDVLPRGDGRAGRARPLHRHAHAGASVVGDRDAAGREHRRARARARARRSTGRGTRGRFRPGKYLYAIDAGPTVRPATGVVTGTTTRSMLTALAKPALFTPNGDGKADSTLVRYQVREPAVVTGRSSTRSGLRSRRSSSSRRPRGRTRFAGTRRGSPTGATGSC